DATPVAIDTIQVYSSGIVGGSQADAVTIRLMIRNAADQVWYLSEVVDSPHPPAGTTTFTPVDFDPSALTWDTVNEDTVLNAFTGLDETALTLVGSPDTWANLGIVNIDGGGIYLEDFAGDGSRDLRTRYSGINWLEEPALPIITLIGSANVSVPQGDPYVDEGATASDVEDGDITADIVVGGDTVDTDAAVGTEFVITYNVTDSDENAAEEVTRTVTIAESCSTPGDLAALGNGWKNLLNGNKVPPFVPALFPDTWAEFDVEGTVLAPGGAGDGDGLPDAVQTAMVATALCGDFPLSQIVTSQYDANLADLTAAVAPLGPLFPQALVPLLAAQMGFSQEMQDTYAGLIFALTQGNVTLDLANYAVFGATKTDSEPFSADGDLDGDGISNVDEYDAVIAAGGDLDLFLQVVSDASAFWPGNPDLPVASMVGLGLLAGAVSLGSLLSLRRKK
ncbi:MAG: DUF5011 domain-containing protein, partial [Nitrospiraceae bacterium]|nr:DUF5011 domain-containing protein [Nitrospiraceae bacterium]